MAGFSNRTFGVEIEAQGLSTHAAARALERAGFECYAEGYNHNTRAHWKIVTDASVGSSGFECVSPVLQGPEGIVAIRKVAQTLADAGAFVDSRCGLHVHFGASDLGVAAVKAVAKRYAKFERDFDSIMPVSRRGRNNTYCGPIPVEQIDRVMNRREFGRIGRFTKVNVAALSRHGTIEFRHHSGTLDPNKIENWIRLLDAFMTATFKRMGEPETGARALARLARPGSKAARLVEWVLSTTNQGARSFNMNDALAVVGWAECLRTLRKQMAGHGFKVVKINETTYALQRVAAGTAPTADAPTAPTADTLFDECDQTIVTFYLARRTQLAAATGGND